MRLLHRTHTTGSAGTSGATGPQDECHALRLIDAALGFASQRGCARHHDAVRLLEALRDELGYIPDVGHAADDADQVLARLPFRDSYRRRDLLDALLDLRRVVETAGRVSPTSRPS